MASDTDCHTVPAGATTVVRHVTQALRTPGYSGTAVARSFARLQGTRFEMSLLEQCMRACPAHERARRDISPTCMQPNNSYALQYFPAFSRNAVDRRRRCSQTTIATQSCNSNGPGFAVFHSPLDVGRSVLFHRNRGLEALRRTTKPGVPCTPGVHAHEGTPPC